MTEFKNVRFNSLKMKILKTLEKQKAGMSLTEITQKIIVSRTTIRARLSELRTSGFVTKDTSSIYEGRWSLTDTAIQYLSRDKLELKLPTVKQTKPFHKQGQVNEFLDTK